MEGNRNAYFQLHATERIRKLLNFEHYLKDSQNVRDKVSFLPESW
jgi:hypothetical protein